MSIREISFPSANGRDTIKAWSYSPLGEPKAVVQIMHGFGEHSRRYLHMISKFNEAGYVVFADDHLGHGKTGVDSGTLGDPHSGGYMTFLKDEKKLHDIAKASYPALPYFVFGHSWGSMLARGYAAHYGNDLAGLMLCGVCSLWPGYELVYNDPDVNEAYKSNPYQPAGKALDLLLGGMTDRIENPNGPGDWIAKDPRVVADHAGDMFNTFDTTLELVYDVCALQHFTETPAWAPMVPQNLPCYLIAGDQDPCGYYGEGLYHVANTLITTGHKVKVKAYSGYRHEVHNEPDLTDDVEAGLISFIEDTLNK